MVRRHLACAALALGALALAAALPVQGVPSVDQDGPAGRLLGGGTHQCGGGAPHQTTCCTWSLTSLGECLPHVGTAGLVHGFPPNLPTYTGVLESRLEQGSRVRIFICTFIFDWVHSCTGSGMWPTGPAPYSHTCRSLAGSGGWSCYIRHQ